MRSPVACRFCRAVEPNDYLLGTNHGGQMGNDGGVCMSMYLRRNHVLGAQERRDPRLEEFIGLAQERWQYASSTARAWLEPVLAEQRGWLW